MELKDVLIKSRKEKELSQDQVAREAGMTTRTYQNYEAGDMPRFDTVIKLQAILEFKWEEVLNENNFAYEIKEPTKEALTSQIASNAKLDALTILVLVVIQSMPGNEKKKMVAIVRDIFTKKVFNKDMEEALSVLESFAGNNAADLLSELSRR